jgi:hypothetical protein
MKGALLAVIVVLLGCTQTIEPAATTEPGADSTVQKIEVYHFHGTNQCYSCRTVGAYAEETIRTFYFAETATGKIAFSSVNYDLPENKELAEKYGVSGSSLWIGVYDSNGFHPEQNLNVWYKIDNKDDYMSYLKGVIEQKLSGK